MVITGRPSGSAEAFRTLWKGGALATALDLGAGAGEE